jgi:hypothetical protein
MIAGMAALAGACAAGGLLGYVVTHGLLFAALALVGAVFAIVPLYAAVVGAWRAAATARGRRAELETAATRPKAAPAARRKPGKERGRARWSGSSEWLDKLEARSEARMRAERAARAAAEKELADLDRAAEAPLPEEVRAVLVRLEERRKKPLS